MTGAAENDKAAKLLKRRELAERIANDIPEGWHVNLGIGVPLLVADYLPPDKEILLHSENGILGMGPIATEENTDPWLVNAGKQNITLLKGASLFNHEFSFALIRGGHIDLCILGAFQIAENGDLANWSISENDNAPAVGGAMDLVAGAPNIWIATDHVAKDGSSKLVEKCTYPLTGVKVVNRIYTDLAIIDVAPQGFVVDRIVADIDFETLQSRTDAKLYRKDEVAA